jgi:sec-independent protein translocase protein TatA
VFGELGLPELLFIMAIALLIFGPRRLGDLGKSLGEGIRNFRSALKEEPEVKPPQEALPSNAEAKPRA